MFGKLPEVPASWVKQRYLFEPCHLPKGRGVLQTPSDLMTSLAPPQLRPHSCQLTDPRTQKGNRQAQGLRILQ